MPLRHATIARALLCAGALLAATPAPADASAILARHFATPEDFAKGNRERIIAVFSYFDRPGVVFTREDQIGFYGRAR